MIYDVRYAVVEVTGVGDDIRGMFDTPLEAITTYRRIEMMEGPIQLRIEVIFSEVK